MIVEAPTESRVLGTLRSHKAPPFWAEPWTYDGHPAKIALAGGYGERFLRLTHRDGPTGGIIASGDYCRWKGLSIVQVG
jgi:hypothetical protein